jgi:TRAP-type mannitol/chloroaromatic compound transport system substrate-binding protein
MKRRQFLQSAGLSLATTAVGKPAIAQSNPAIRWRITSSFPKSLDIAYGAFETIAKMVAEATGEIAPALQARDAVTSGTVEACHTGAYYYFGKKPALAVFCAVPFGLNTRQQNARFYDGDGTKLMNDFRQRFNVYALPAGNTGRQMGGWFRKEIKEVGDFRGLKFRIGGFAGLTIQKLGGVPQQIAAGDIYSSLEIRNHRCCRMGWPVRQRATWAQQNRYYYPAWWEGSTAVHLMINLAKWHELPMRYQTIVAGAAAHVNAEYTARYDARNPAAFLEHSVARTYRRVVRFVSLGRIADHAVQQAQSFDGPGAGGDDADEA